MEQDKTPPSGRKTFDGGYWSDLYGRFSTGKVDRNDYSLPFLILQLEDGISNKTSK